MPSADPDLIERCRRRYRIERQAPSPPLTGDELSNATDSLGFDPPPTLSELYHVIGNGGFGPAYGLLGLGGGATDDMEKTADQLYALFTTPDVDEPNWDWPQRLLPIGYWGCGMYSCVDCSDSIYQMVRYDGNGYTLDNTVTDCLFPEHLNLREWIMAWANGYNLCEVVGADVRLEDRPRAPRFRQWSRFFQMLKW